MIKTKFNTKELNRTLNNVISYSEGFTRGVKYAQPNFNKELSVFIEEALNKYIDAKARANPQSLHHVYEWDMVGSPSGRLFNFTTTHSQNFITFVANLKQSTKPSRNSTEPFRDKAEIMEKQITVTIEPKDSNFLVFEDDGETVFTSDAVVIETPGGSAVGGSFERVVRDFFNNYLTVGLLKGSGLFDKLRYAKEYSRRFSQGAKSGSSPGITAGREYLNLGGIGIE